MHKTEVLKKPKRHLSRKRQISVAHTTNMKQTGQRESVCKTSQRLADSIKTVSMLCVCAREGEKEVLLLLCESQWVDWGAHADTGSEMSTNLWPGGALQWWRIPRSSRRGTGIVRRQRVWLFRYALTQHHPHGCVRNYTSGHGWSLHCPWTSELSEGENLLLDTQTFSSYRSVLRARPSCWLADKCKFWQWTCRHQLRLTKLWGLRCLWLYH